MNKSRWILANNLESLLAHARSAKISKREICEQTGLSRVSLDGYIKAAIEPGLDALQRLADFFHITVAELLKENFWPKSLETEAGLPQREVHDEAQNLRLIHIQDLLRLIATLDNREAELLLSAAKNFGPRPWATSVASHSSDDTANSIPDPRKRHRNNR